MHIRLQCIRFKQLMQEFIKNSSESLNFSVANGRLYVQSFKGIVIRRSVECEEIRDLDESLDITAIIDDSIFLMNDKSDVVIELLGKSISIMQDSYMYITAKQPESIVRDSEFDADRTLSSPSYEIYGYVSNIKVMEALAKQIGTTVNSVTIKDKVAYTMVSNCMFVSSLDLEDMSISTDALKILSNNLKADRVNYSVNKNRQMMSFKLDDSDGVGLIAYKPASNTVLGVCQWEMDAMQDTDITIDITKYSKVMLAIAKTYKGSAITLSIGTDGLALTVNRVSSNVVVGQVKDLRLSIRLSTGQLEMLAKTLNYTGIRVKRGVNKIGLWTENGRKVLIFSGTVFYKQ